MGLSLAEGALDAREANEADDARSTESVRDGAAVVDEAEATPEEDERCDDAAVLVMCGGTALPPSGVADDDSLAF